MKSRKGKTKYSKKECCDKPMAKATVKRLEDNEPFNILFCVLCGKLLADEEEKKK